MKNVFKSKLKTVAVSAGLLCSAIASTAQAHPIWVLPGEFNVSGEESRWVTFDVTASHTVFGYDKGLSLRDLAIFSPDGRRSSVDHYFKGKKRSVFDLLLDQDGTYMVGLERPAFNFTTYKLGDSDQIRRARGKRRLPEGARDITTYETDTSSVAFVTRNAPTDTVFKPTNRGFELTPQTHPSDFVQGEEVSFLVTLDGEPVKDAEVEITPGGTQYRDNRNSIEMTTDKSGKITFTPEYTGPWLLTVDLTYPTESPSADYVRASRLVTFEVAPG